MTEVAFSCGLGFAPAVTLTAAATVDLSTVDGNQVIISGTTAISSFGSTPNLLRIIGWASATPLVASGTFQTLFNVNRTTNPGEYSIFISDSFGRWIEICAPQTLVNQEINNNLFGRVTNRQSFTSSQTITIAGTSCLIKLWGATGGSGGTGTSGNSSGSGAAGYLEKFLTGLTIGNTLIFTCGSAGSAGSSGGGNAGNGTASTLASGTQTISTLTANGSNGSGGSNVSFITGTPGGTASGGDINVTGQSGGDAIWNSTNNIFIVGKGGSNFYSLGADGATSSHAGNAGNPGGLLIEWYS